MKVYALLKIRTVGKYNKEEELEVLEAIFATREAAENEVERALFNDLKVNTVIVKEYEVKQ